MPLSIAEGVADGVAEVRKAVRYQIKHGARCIKVCSTGGIMSHGGASAGAQQYSDEELRVVAEEAHRAGIKVTTHAHGDQGMRAAINAGIDCIEHGSLASDETLALMAERGTFLVSTTCLADAMDLTKLPPSMRAKAEAVFPQARQTTARAIKAGVKIAIGTDAPAIPHGENWREFRAMVERGMTPLQTIQAATVNAAELVGVQDRGSLMAGLLADIIAVAGDPLQNIEQIREVRFVMKDGRIHKHPDLLDA